MEPQREIAFWKPNVTLLAWKSIEIINPFQCGPPNNKMHYIVPLGLFYRSSLYWLIMRWVILKENFKYFLKIFFFMWTIFEVFIEIFSLQYHFCFI